MIPLINHHNKTLHLNYCHIIHKKLYPLGVYYLPHSTFRSITCFKEKVFNMCNKTFKYYTSRTMRCKTILKLSKYIYRVCPLKDNQVGDKQSADSYAIAYFFSFHFFGFLSVIFTNHNSINLIAKFLFYIFLYI